MNTPGISASCPGQMLFELEFPRSECYIVRTGGRRSMGEAARRVISNKGGIMKRTLIAALAASAAVLVAAYLTGADGTAASAPQTGMSGAQTSQAMTPAQQQNMQQPMVETEECSEGYILLMPCPVCHTCPVCQANCGTAHALKCCLGNKKQVFNTTGGASSGSQTQDCTSGSGTQQHIMTNKAEAVKHAAGHAAAAPQTQTDGAVMSIFTIESD